jgi:hypothetical protein
MTTLILTVLGLLMLAAIQTTGASDSRSAARLPFARHTAVRVPSDAGARALPADVRLAETGRGVRVRTHVARLP